VRRVVVFLSVLALALATLVPVASAQEGETTLVVGLTQNWETLNPTAGWLMSEWEMWILQYSALTTNDADMETVPDLAESWIASDDGLTWTYTLREGLTWSDGTPLTAEDVAWTINTSAEQEWMNHYEVTADLTATVIDERTVQITSAVPDPRLPDVGVLILPKHIWEPVATDGEEVTYYENLDGVGSGPYVLEEYRPSQTLTMRANPNWYGWEGREPGVDRIIFRQFGNMDALVAALKSGEIDFAASVPGSAIDDLEADPNIEVIVGFQAGWEQIGTNAGDGDGDVHPAMTDVNVRQAMAYAVDTQAIVEDLWYGTAREIHSINPSIDKRWTPEIPADLVFAYDPAKANQILDEAGYLDTDGDGVREMPGGGDPLHFRHVVNTNSDMGAAIGELFVGWMDAIGIEVELISLDSDQLGAVIAEGTYETYNWGWTPSLDPSSMLSVFICDEIGSFNDVNWCSEEYDALYEAQKVELDEATRLQQVHEATLILTEGAVYIGMVEVPEIQAYRADRWEGFLRQPAADGPVLFNFAGISYPNIRPVGAEGGPTTTAPGDTTTQPSGDTTGTTAPGQPEESGGGVSPAVIGGLAAVVVAAIAVVVSRRKSEDERE
jgi:peptide/nickel transport system substrate-binding protein